MVSYESQGGLTSHSKLCSGRSCSGIIVAFFKVVPPSCVRDFMGLFAPDQPAESQTLVKSAAW